MTAIRTAALLLAVPAGFAGVWHLQHSIDAQQSRLEAGPETLLVSSGKLVRALSLEYAPLAADYYWTRTVQYYGEKRARHDSNVSLLWPLLDVTTQLDPNLVVAYRFGATFLAEPAPRGAGRPDLAVQLIERGIRANPDEWRLYEDLGFVYYFNLRDYPKAASAFFEGSKNPASMLWMKILAAKIMEQGESPETSEFLWTEVYNSAKDPEIRKNAMVHLQLLRVDRDLAALNSLVAEYSSRAGRRPQSLQDLVQARLLPGVPVDPRGFPYVMASGKAQLDPASPLTKEAPIYQRPIPVIP